MGIAGKIVCACWHRGAVFQSPAPASLRSKQTGFVPPLTDSHACVAMAQAAFVFRAFARKERAEMGLCRREKVATQV